MTWENLYSCTFEIHGWKVFKSMRRVANTRLATTLCKSNQLSDLGCETCKGSIINVADY